MNFEPKNFFIGLIDFFAILLPGALFTYLVKDTAGPLFLGERYAQLLSGTEGGVVFLFTSYLIGHFIFLIGSRWLDDLYDEIKSSANDTQLKRLSEGRRFSPRIVQWFLRGVFKFGSNQLVEQVGKVKTYYLEPMGNPAVVNSFQWSKARLTIEAPAAMETIHRFEADQKFFRSLIVLLVLLILVGPLVGQPAILIASLVLLPPAFWRYVDQRDKATRQAYIQILALESGLENGYRTAISGPKSEITHAGGVVFKRSFFRTEYLLIEAKGRPGEWVLPKGHIELGEDPKEAAVREVNEESGHWARVRARIGKVKFEIGENAPTVTFFLMECIREGKEKTGEGRGQKWMPIEAAKKTATYQESIHLLDKAEAERKKLMLF